MHTDAYTAPGGIDQAPYDEHCNVSRTRPIRRAASTPKTCADTKNLLEEVIVLAARMRGQLHVQLARRSIEVDQSCRHARRPIRGAQRRVR